MNILIYHLFINLKGEVKRKVLFTNNCESLD